MGVACWLASDFLLESNLGIQIGGFAAIGLAAIMTLFLAFLAFSNDTDYNLQCYILTTSIFGLMFLIIGVVTFVKGTGSDNSIKAAAVSIGLAATLFINALVFHLVYTTDQFIAQHIEQGERALDPKYAQTHNHGTQIIEVTQEEAAKIPEEFIAGRTEIDFDP